MLLRVILVLSGLVLCLIGLNTALGGMRTLGWQFPSEVLTVTDPLGFARHDSNARLFGGFFAAGGAVIALAGLRPSALPRAAIAVLGMIAVGGLFRLAQPGFLPLTDPELLPSLFAELVLGPLLALWVFRSRLA